jgi:hypothetical protein
MARQHYTAAEVRAMIGADATPEEYEEFFQWIDSTEKRFTYEWVKDNCSFGEKDPLAIVKIWRGLESKPPEENEYCPEYIAPDLTKIPREQWPGNVPFLVPEPMKTYMDSMTEMTEDEEEFLIKGIETALNLRPEYTVILDIRQFGTQPKHIVACLSKLRDVIKKGWLAINSLREPAWWTCVEVKSVHDYVPDFLSPPAPILKFDFPIVFDTKEEAQAENETGKAEYKRQIEAGERDADDEWEDDNVVEVWVFSTHEYNLWPLRLHEYGLGDMYTKEHGDWTFSQLQAMR